MISTKQLLYFMDPEAREDPTQPAHIDSALCWCDPIVAMDEFGQGSVAHKDVTWN